MRVAQLRNILAGLPDDMHVYTEDGFRVTVLIGSRPATRTIESDTDPATMIDAPVLMLQSR